MKLSDRLKGLEGDGPTRVPPPPPTPDGDEAAVPARLLPRPDGADVALDPLAHLKQRAQDVLFARLGARLYDASMTEDQLQRHVLQELGQIMGDERAPLSPAERQQLVTDISHDILGYGPIQQFLDDDTVTEVMVNAQSSIYVEEAGKLHRTHARFLSEDHLRRVIERIVSQVGRRIDESSPMVDARLPDGSRVNAVIPPLAVDGPSLTIRKFARDPYQVPDLIRFGTLSPEIADLLRACVEGRLNVLICGGTGTGKTTMLNVLSSFIPGDERIVTIEDAVELQLQQDHVIRLESRPPNIEGQGAVAIRDLVRNALRMRPDRIIVGEVRGGEALDMLQAMNTGHDGSLATLHANSPRDALSRLETMVLMAGMDLPVRAIREQVASALDLIVHVTRLRDGSRRVTHITEVQGMEGQIITLSDIFLFDFSAGLDEYGRFRGGQRPTGLRPGFLDRLRDFGIVVPSQLFGAPMEVALGGGSRWQEAQR
jgi:pilus assembly protein CpaF